MSQTKGHNHDLGMMGVLLHVIGDAANNVGVIIAATVIWKANYPARFYADPAVSMAIALMILLSSIPLGMVPTRPDVFLSSNLDVHTQSGRQVQS